MHFRIDSTEADQKWLELWGRARSAFQAAASESSARERYKLKQRHRRIVTAMAQVRKENTPLGLVSHFPNNWMETGARFPLMTAYKPAGATLN